MMENERNEKTQKGRVRTGFSHKPEAHTPVNGRKCSSDATEQAHSEKILPASNSVLPLTTPFYLLFSFK